MMNVWRLLTLLSLLFSPGTTALPAAVESLARHCFYLSNPTAPQPTGWKAGRKITAGWVNIVYILYFFFYIFRFPRFLITSTHRIRITDCLERVLQLVKNNSEINNTTTTIQQKVPDGVCESDENYSTVQYVDSLVCISLWVVEHIILSILLKLSPTLRGECVKLLHNFINRCVRGENQTKPTDQSVEPMDTSD